MSEGTAIAIAVVGRTRTGKTTFIKNELLTAYPAATVYVYDVNNEYPQFYKPIAKSGTFPSVKEFLTYAGKLRNSVLLFEEATIYFKHANNSEELQNILIRKRHMNNIIILTFHSLRAVPLYILESLNFIVIKKTNDRPDVIESKFKDHESIYDAYADVMDNPDPYATEIVDLYDE